MTPKKDFVVGAISGALILCVSACVRFMFGEEVAEKLIAVIWFVVFSGWFSILFFAMWRDSDETRGGRGVRTYFDKERSGEE